MDANVVEGDDHDREPGDRLSDALARIEEQGRQTLELVRALNSLLMPKEGGREGPSLEDLLAAPIVQQREMIEIVRAIQDGASGLPVAWLTRSLGRLPRRVPYAAGGVSPELWFRRSHQQGINPMP